jgi:hypothetical protein
MASATVEPLKVMRPRSGDNLNIAVGAPLDQVLECALTLGLLEALHCCQIRKP